MESRLRERISLLSSNSQFLRLWIGLTQSQIGTLINLIALTLYVYDKTQSGAAVGKLEISVVLPSLAVGLFAGVIVDRYSRKWIMVIADIARAALFVIIAFLPEIPVIYAIVFASSLAGLFFVPAYASSLPLILKKKGLMDANSLTELTSQLVRVIGPGVAGLLYIQFGLRFICIFNSITFLVSAALIATLTIPLTERKGGDRMNLKAPIADAREGFHYLISDKLTRWVLFASCGIQLGAGAIVVLIVMFVKEVLGGGDAAYGMVISAVAVGSVLGAVLTWFRGRLAEGVVLKALLLANGFFVLFISLTSTLWMAMVLFALVGAAQTAVSIAINTVLQQHLAPNMMGRVFATLAVAFQTCQLLSMALGSFFADVIGVRSVYIIGSSIVLLTAVLVMRYIVVPDSPNLAGEQGIHLTTE